jgi:hypothetical protein
MQRRQSPLRPLEIERSRLGRRLVSRHLTAFIAAGPGRSTHFAGFATPPPTTAA